MEERIVEIVKVVKKKKETVKVTWSDALKYYNGYAGFEELKQKYGGSHENKKGKL